MHNTFADGAIVIAKIDPLRKLEIKRYLGNIYYCTAVDDPSKKLLAFFERELSLPTPTA